MAKPSTTGWLLAAVPALGFLALTKLVLSRPTVPAPATQPVTRQAAQPVRSSVDMPASVPVHATLHPTTRGASDIPEEELILEPASSPTPTSEPRDTASTMMLSPNGCASRCTPPSGSSPRSRPASHPGPPTRFRPATTVLPPPWRRSREPSDADRPARRQPCPGRGQHAFISVGATSPASCGCRRSAGMRQRLRARCRGPGFRD